MNRDELTFEQAEGAVPLPTQLALREVSPELRALLWSAIYSALDNTKTAGEWAGVYVGLPWQTILLDKHVFRDHKMADEFDPLFKVQVQRLKPIFTDGDYLAILGLFQWILRHPACPDSFAHTTRSILTYCRSAYRLIAKTIVPVATPAEQASLERAFAEVSGSGFEGARTHLQNAAAFLTDGKFADSVRESVHGVESVARVLEPKNSLDHALSALEAKVNIHRAMKAGFTKLYGYASDEEGVRHPLLEGGDANVDETDAIFMLGACASFVTYLIGKGRKAGLA